MKIHSRQTDVSTFYNEASLVLNLSDKRQFVETFGLTALEAMSAGLPVIVPSEGGIAEMVENGVNGYKMDVQELEKIKSTIKQCFSNYELYMNLSNNALNCSKKYSENNLAEDILNILKNK